ncbi:MAG TPA: hypothetical protein VD770_03075 [Coxiellaceae bacterium]|nr:hypothetical protein [Coxiellaceae bacterium]HYF97945.1 hypothetical protein [Coxiellaceae bacterium]
MDMQTKNSVFDIKLDPEEADLLASLERGEWKTVPDFEEQKRRAQEMAVETLKKQKRRS